MKFRVLSDGVKYKVQAKTLIGWKDYNRSGKYFKANFYFPSYESAVQHVRAIYGDDAVFVQPFTPVNTKTERIQEHVETTGKIQSCINVMQNTVLSEVRDDIKKLKGCEK